MPQRFAAGVGLLSEGINACLDPGDIGLGGKVGVEKGDMLLGQGFGLLLGEAAWQLHRRGTRKR